MKDQFDILVNHLFNNGFFMEEAIEILEKTLIERALEREKGNRSAASKALGIHRNTLQRKMLEYGLAGVRRRKRPARAVRAPRARRAEAV